jgi:hypothetical protein
VCLGAIGVTGYGKTTLISKPCRLLHESSFRVTATSAAADMPSSSFAVSLLLDLGKQLRRSVAGPELTLTLLCKCKPEELNRCNQSVSIRMICSQLILMRKEKLNICVFRRSSKIYVRQLLHVRK